MDSNLVKMLARKVGYMELDTASAYDNEIDYATRRDRHVKNEHVENVSQAYNSKGAESKASWIAR